MAERYLESDTAWLMEWIVPARPPVHPEPMTGRQTFDSFEAAVNRFNTFSDRCTFVSLTLRITEYKDFTEDAKARIGSNRKE